MSQCLTRADYSAELDRRFRKSEFFEFAPEWSPAQRVPLVSQKDFVFVIGGNGSGKTTVGSWAVACRVLGFNPLNGQNFRSEPGRDYSTKTYNIYVVGTTDDDVQQRLMPSVMAWLPEDLEILVDNKHNTWTIGGVVRVFWKSIAQKARAFQGDECDFVWIDEDPEKRDVWSEILARTFRRWGHQVMVTMTAWQGVQWLYTFMFAPGEYPQEDKCIVRIPVTANPYYRLCNCGHSKRFHVDGKACTKPKCECQAHDDSMGQTKLRKFKQRYRGLEYDIRVLGHYRLMAGKNVVSPAVIDEHLERAAKRPSPACGFFNSATQFVSVEDPEDPRAIARVSVPPAANHQYVMGVDVGGGNPTGDYHAAVVLDTETCEQVAILHTRNCEPRDFGLLVVQMARFYQDAFVVPEINNHGLSMVDRMLELGYGHLYTRRMLDGIAASPQKKRGFWTDKRSKPAAVDTMVDLVNHTWKIYERVILDELYGYLYLKENREGKHGIGNGNPDGHDDLCSALFLAAMGWQTLGLLYASPLEDPLPPQPPRRKQMIEMIEADLAGQAERESVSQEADEFSGDAGESFQDSLFGEMGGEQIYWGEDGI